MKTPTLRSTLDCRAIVSSLSIGLPAFFHACQVSNQARLWPPSQHNASTNSTLLQQSHSNLPQYVPYQINSFEALPSAPQICQEVPRKRVSIACRECRRRKVRCSGHRGTLKANCNRCVTQPRKQKLVTL
ncbi:hypothetical protein BGZ61DRAFT_460718 [Ilyonectria robusta]|uniref:uncharacterized protein n=1 Tax=Ilyonectria robusta TaxID=1079257 RepID=UPI001E8E22BB|nr:uncharacterized protein BGZ61DRAFT_460718 [Ilyonectria robusta]KAH8669285.1 hypothetical protein BGZ61DRAFT_460718 [Ilyonectria robusta]